MGAENIILWLLLLAVFAWCAYWHVSENIRLSREWSDKPQLRRFAWSRSLQLLAALAVAITLIITYDWQLGVARDSINQLMQVNADLSARKPVVRIIEKTVPAKKEEPPVEPSAPAEDIPAPVILKSAIEDVYSPAPNEAEAKLDDIKKRYEDILVTHMFLKKCGKVAPEDYLIIDNGMTQEIQLAKPADSAKFQANIMSAASGSYNEIYMNSSCDNAGLAQLLAQYQTYITSLKERFPAKK